MESNPFDPPGSSGRPPAGGGGEVSIAVAIDEAMAALKNNWLMWILLFIAGQAIVSVSVLLCVVPVFFVAPMIAWGQYRYVAESLDGEASVDVFFSGFNDPMKALGRVWTLFLLYFAVALPGLIVGGVGTALTDSTGQEAFVIVGQLMYGAYMLALYLLILIKFLPMFWLVFGEEMPVMEALRESWRVSRGMFLPGIAAFALTIAAATIGLILCFVGVIPATLFSWALYMSLGRQAVRLAEGRPIVPV